jgi:hypothetical protein
MSAACLRGDHAHCELIFEQRRLDIRDALSTAGPLETVVCACGCAHPRRAMQPEGEMMAKTVPPKTDVVAPTNGPDTTLTVGEALLVLAAVVPILQKHGIMNAQGAIVSGSVADWISAGSRITTLHPD